MHKLLARQIQKHFGSMDLVPDHLRPFVESIEQSYVEFDDERALLEHSMETVSEELVDRFRRLREALATSQQAEEGMARAASLTEATLESTADGILVVDRAGRIVLTNQKFLELWRISPDVVAEGDDEKAMQQVLDQLPDPDAFVSQVREVYENLAAESFDVLTFKDGRIYERYSLPQRIRGEIVGRVWSFRDVSERRALEDQLRQSQKLEAIGSLAGGVAHDFNNILTVIKAHGEFLLDSCDSPEQRADVEAITLASDRAARLTRQLLAFSRKQVLQPVPLDLGTVITGLLPMLRRLIGEDIEVRVAIAPNLGSILADPGQMEQIIVNLAVNARDAMRLGGVMHIRVAAAAPLPPVVGEPPTTGEVEFIAVSISDTGCGIPPEHRDRIFEPFFTTKPAGSGTGLGLSTVFGIVKQTGGRVALESEVGIGTTVTVFLPRAASPVGDARRAVVPSSNVPAGTATILVAEDEDGVRSLVSRILARSGYTVLIAHDGTDALRIAMQYRGKIDLLLTDAVMPEMGGLELSGSIRTLRPAIRIVYMSGYTATEIERQGEFLKDAVLLDKPFSANALLTAVATALLDDGAALRDEVSTDSVVGAHETASGGRR